MKDWIIFLLRIPLAIIIVSITLPLYYSLMIKFYADGVGFSMQQIDKEDR